jgi:CheY-like chemotaxis protein
MAKTEETKRILIVDDVPANIRVAHEILKNLYRTRVATSGVMALESAKATPPPDLILLDIMMPGMDGYEVCARLKADTLTREIPVIFLTAMTDVVDETRGFAVGAVDYIHKPFLPPVLLARVQTHLKLREAYDQLLEIVLGTLGPPEAHATAFHAKTAAPLVAQLKSLLEAKDGDAADVIQQVTDALVGGVGAKRLDALRKSVSEFDFEAALGQLSEVVKECNLKPG